MRNAPDKIFFGTIIVLVLAGMFILTSASMGLLAKSGSSFSGTLFNQFAFGVVGGFIILFVASRINYKKWRRFALPFFIFTFLLTLLVFAPKIGFEYGGAKRWLDLKFITFQPSELLKFGFIVYLSSWIASRKNQIKSFKFGFLPFVIIIGLVGAVLVKEPDIGTLGIVAVTGLFLFLLGGGRFTQIALLIILGIGLLAGLIWLEPYRMDRLLTFLNPNNDPTGISYQLRQSLIAIGSGGVFGRGFGMSIQKFNYLPEPIGDSVFAVFGEEFGFVGSVALVFLFLFFLFQGFRIAMNAPDDFGRLLASGIAILIVVEAFVNIAAMVGVVPLTGIPLVFVSKGGSALLVTLAEIGVLLNISRYSRG
jgi:cell division protein FtsW